MFCVLESVLERGGCVLVIDASVLRAEPLCYIFSPSNSDERLRSFGQTVAQLLHIQHDKNCLSSRPNKNFLVL